MPSSEQRSTIQDYPTRSVHTYYGDESDEGLVEIVCRNSNKEIDFVFIG